MTAARDGELVDTGYAVVRRRGQAARLHIVTEHAAHPFAPDLALCGVQVAREAVLQ